MSDAKNILVIGEWIGGELTPHTREILGGCRESADKLGGRLELALLGAAPEAAAGEAISLGADAVLALKNEALDGYEPDLWLGALQGVIRERDPEMVVMGQTAAGRDLAPRLAYRLGTGVAMDCVSIEADGGGQIRMTRPVYGCKAMAVMTSKTRPAVATVRSKAMKAPAPDRSRSGDVVVVEVEVEVDESARRSRVIERVSEKPEGVPLEDAAVVVSGGRGIGGKEGFDGLEELASLIGGAVGASRPPCDSGWVPVSKQVGLTGKIIRPGLYLAVALSGSSQHMAGCQDSGKIVAINKDPEANIFSYAHYGVVGDYKKILPPLMERLRELMGK